MTDFKATFNKKTEKTTYYVDNRRVSEEVYNVKQTICRIAGKSYNSSLLTSDKKYIRSSFSYN